MNHLNDAYTHWKLNQQYQREKQDEAETYRLHQSIRPKRKPARKRKPKYDI